MNKGYDVRREHRQQGCVSPAEERVNMYKQMMAEEQARENEKTRWHPVGYMGTWHNKC